MKIWPTSKRHKIISLSMYGAVALLIFFYLIFNKVFLEAEYYKCLDTGDSDTARCLLSSNNGSGCYGYYSLKGKTLKDGIVPPHNTTSIDTATCEGFAPKELYTYSQSGKFIKVRPATSEESGLYAR